MSNKLSKVIVTFVAVMLLVSVVPAFAGVPSEPHTGNAIWIEPSTVSLTTANANHTIGYKFNITVWVNWETVSAGATGIDSWQFYLYFDKTYLRATRCGYTAGTTSQLFEGMSTTPVTPVINNDTGLVMHFETVAPDVKSVPCTGSLAWIEFEVIKVPAKGETLTAVFNIKNVDTWVTDDSGIYYDGTAYGYNGNYEFKWESPPPAHMAVEHDGSSVWPLVYERWYPAVGQTFNAQIYIKDLAAAWGLTSASFCLCYNSTIIGTSESDITLDAAWTGTVTLVPASSPEELDRIEFAVTPTDSVSGKVLVATVKFTVVHQEESPPAPFGYYDVSPLNFCDVALSNHIMSINTSDPENGAVWVYALTAIPLPWLEVSPKEVTFGPEYSVGKEFNVNIVVKNLHPAWKMIAYQVRLSFDPRLLEVVSVTEGPFLQDSRWNKYGTFFIGDADLVDPVFGPNVYIFDILSPDPETGVWPQELGLAPYPSAPGPDVPNLYPPVNPVLATIRFKVIYQDSNETCGLNILPFWLPEDCHFIDINGEYIPEATDRIVNGTYKVITPVARVGRVIDVYGGAENMGYGSAPFPAPYGGQGPNAPMDLVVAQSKVYLFAKVTYNNWPVQSKDVSFEINGPAFANPVKLTARTNSDGIASISYRMPWPCENPESTFGTYTVTATVNIADVVVKDTLTFEYNYLLTITKVTTDKLEYAHEEYVKVTIEYDYNALQSYPVLFYAVIQDELGVPIGQAVIPASGGTGTVSIQIPKWAFAGLATVTVNAFDVDPTEGGAAWCPPATTTIWILPE